MSLLKKLAKTNRSSHSSILSESQIFTKTSTPTDIPMLNVAFSGSIDGGFTSGLTTIAGPSKHFKTLFGLICLKSYLKQNKDAIALFYDSEFGTPTSYFEALDIDTNRVLHIPITNVEELTHDISVKLAEIERGDKVFLFIDSIGNLASKKEADDALDGKSVVDMTRAKSLKSLFRIVTPHLSMKDIPMVVVNHTYDTQELYSKKVVSGGTGVYYSSDNIWIVGRQQDKVGKEVEGYHYIINVEKSRFLVEKSKIPITVSTTKGISKWSGLLEIALETGHVVKPSNGWYTPMLINSSTGEVVDESPAKKYRRAETDCEEFWTPIFEKTDFAKAIENRYKLGTVKLMQDQETPQDIDKAIDHE